MKMGLIMNSKRWIDLLRCAATTALVLGLLAPPQSIAAEATENWPQWRGPQSTGVAPAAQPPLEWGPNKNIKWKVAIPGRGASTPIIWNDQIFIQTAVPTGKKIDLPPAKPDEAAADADPAVKPEEPTAEPRPVKPDDPKPAPSDVRQGRGGGGGRRGFPRISQPTEEQRFVLMCLERKTGRTLWERVARTEVPHEGHHPDHGFASHSPVTDGACVCAYFGSRGLHCYDMQGKPKWEKDLGRMKTKLSFGEGGSPALFGNTIVVVWDHEGEDFIVALDKETGRELWRKPREEGTGWSTPLVASHSGRTEVITAASNKIRSYDLASGELLWEASGLSSNAIPSPVASPSVVYVTSGFRGNALLAIRLGEKGDLTGTGAILWSHDKNTPYVPSPLLYGERLYLYSSNNGILSCFDVKGGKPLFGPKRVEGLQNVYASPVGAGGRVYLVGRDGAAVVIKDGDEFEILATNRLDDGFDASPAIVGKELFLRGKEHLYCIAEGEAQAK